MKYFRRYLCVLLLCVLLLTAFSLNVSAKSVDVPKVNIEQDWKVLYNNNIQKETVMSFFPRDGETTSSFEYTSYIQTNGSSQMVISFTNTFIPVNKDYILTTDGECTVDFKYIDNKFEYYYYHSTQHGFFYLKDFTMRGLLYYSDGTMEYFDLVHNVNNNYKATFTPKKNVTKIELIYNYSFVPPSDSLQISAYLGETADTNFELIVNQEDEKTGLLKKIFSGITNGFNNLKDGLNNVISSITELPSKLWNLIENGLKSLFVPSEEFIVTFKDNIDGLLEDKLGAVYQVVHILTDSWDRIQANDERNSIEIPLTTIDLPNNNTFSFGGMSVAIVPQGFDFIVTIIKTVVGIVCTILFVNGLRHKYEEVMGVEK